MALILIVLYAFTVMNASAMTNNSSAIIPSIDNRTINGSSMVNISAINQSTKNDSVVASVHAVPVIDLSGYGKNRLNKNLAGYRNIIYPMTASRGFTASTSGGGGGGCGC